MQRPPQIPLPHSGHTSAHQAGYARVQHGGAPFEGVWRRIQGSARAGRRGVSCADCRGDHTELPGYNVYIREPAVYKDVLSPQSVRRLRAYCALITARAISNGYTHYWRTGVLYTYCQFASAVFS
jgi:hypothetical protein